MSDGQAIQGRMQVWDADAYRSSVEDRCRLTGTSAYIPEGAWSSVPVPHLTMVDFLPDTKWIEELEEMLNVKVSEARASGSNALTLEWQP